MPDYDIITVGGGLGGAALAKAMAENGFRVLVLERETQFKDRVRGEQMATWGAADAKALGIYDLLLSTCATKLTHWDVYAGSMLLQHRDLVATTPHALPNLTFYHPEMQETLLAAAAAAGAEVRRGVRVRGVTPGAPVTVTFNEDGREETPTARLVVAADGRNSPARGWAGFSTHKDEDRLQIAGLLMDGLSIPDSCSYIVINPVLLKWAVFFPQGNGRVRTYLTARTDSGVRFQGEKDVPSYIQEFKNLGGDPKVIEGARASGPLATFNGADEWVDHAYRDGVALLGDAAGTSDPCYGQGLSLTVHGARLLRDALVANDDWDAAGHAYAEQQDRDFQDVRKCEDWFTQFFYDAGPEAGARRAKAMALIGQDPDRVPDTLQSGPGNAVLDEAAKARFFAEDV